MTQLLTAKEAAARLGISVRHLRTLPIRKVPIGTRNIRYREADLEKWIAKRTGERPKEAA